MQTFDTTRDVQSAPRRTKKDQSPNVQAASRTSGGFPQAGQGDAARQAAEVSKRDPIGSVPHQSTLEASFGQSLGHIPCYSGENAKQASRSIDANAFSFGNSVALGDKTDLGTVAEEVAHVMQRANTGLQVFSQPFTDERSTAEVEAQSCSELVVAGESVPSLSASLGPDTIARSRRNSSGRNRGAGRGRTAGSLSSRSGANRGPGSNSRQSSTGGRQSAGARQPGGTGQTGATRQPGGTGQTGATRQNAGSSRSNTQSPTTGRQPGRQTPPGTRQTSGTRQTAGTQPRTGTQQRTNTQQRTGAERPPGPGPAPTPQQRQQQDRFLDSAVHQTRGDLTSQTGNPHAPRRTDTPEATAGWCAASSSMFECNVAEATGGRRDQVQAGLRTVAGEGFEGSHVFNVASFEETGDHYLVDTTVEQFFGENSTDEVVQGVSDVGSRLEGVNPELAETMRTRGHTRLTPEVAAQYLGSFDGNYVTDPEEQQALYERLVSGENAMENDWMPERQGDGPESDASYAQRARRGREDFYSGSTYSQRYRRGEGPQQMNLQDPETQQKFDLTQLGGPRPPGRQPVQATPPSPRVQQEFENNRRNRGGGNQ